MKRIGGLWEAMLAWENLLLAYRKAKRGKRRRPDVAQFGCDLEVELLALQQQLRDGSYQPGAYRQFTVYERKPRVISVAPFRDRVVHHAVMNVIEPPLDKRFIDDCYACRQGKGVHKAVDRYQRYATRYAYVLKLDICRYFPSIDHAILLSHLQRRIKDPQVLALLETIIGHSPEPDGPLDYFLGDDLLTPLERRKGLPIGNLTSQFFANLYLDDFDHWLKETLRVPAYLRYVDDFYLLDNNKARLWDACAQIGQKLAELRLRLHPRKRQVCRTADWVDVLGYLIKPHQRRLRNDNGLRFRRKLHRLAAAYAQGRVNFSDINPSVQSWIGHARHADTEGLRKTLFDGVIFRRASA